MNWLKPTSGKFVSKNLPRRSPRVAVRIVELETASARRAGVVRARFLAVAGRRRASGLQHYDVTFFVVDEVTSPAALLRRKSSSMQGVLIERTSNPFRFH